MDKQNVAYTMEYFSALNGNEVLTHVTIWMNIKGIMLREISQAQKDKEHMIPLI